MQIQSLETRKLLAEAVVDGSTLIYRGTDAAENILAQITATTATFNTDGEVEILDLAGVTKTRIFLAGGADTLELDAQNAPALSQVTLYGGGGSDVITLSPVEGLVSVLRVYLEEGDDKLNLSQAPLHFPLVHAENMRASVYGDAGNDSVTATAGHDYIILGDGFDTLTA